MDRSAPSESTIPSHPVSGSLFEMMIHKDKILGPSDLATWRPGDLGDPGTWSRPDEFGEVGGVHTCSYIQEQEQVPQLLLLLLLLLVPSTTPEDM